MHINRVRPTALVEYKRIAFTHPMQDIRITLDFDIRSSETYLVLFDNNAVLKPNEDFSFGLVEVKFNNFLPGFVKEMLSSYAPEAASYSKYAASRYLLGSF
jgi:hypothetical protein